jgi:hypothetical protein
MLAVWPIRGERRRGTRADSEKVNRAGRRGGCLSDRSPERSQREQQRKSEAPVTAVASGAPIRFASQPSHRKPSGPVPMQTDSTPMMRERISRGAAR